MKKKLLKKYLEKNIDQDFTDDELQKMQSVGGVYSDLEDEEVIYSKVDIKSNKIDK